MSIARKYLLLSAIVGAAVSLALFCLLIVSYSENERLESRLGELESQLAKQSEVHDQSAQLAGPGVATSPSDQLFKDLSTRFVGDERSLAEKLRDFLKEQSSLQDVAIAAKVITELADNRDAVSDADLIWLYEQNPPLLIKRVVAQTRSFRGDNQLIDTYIEQFKSGLSHDNPAERRRVLGELAKTRYAGAAELIAPLLKDPDTTVVLDALLAIRATGNEKHVLLIEPLVSSGDESVSWLATDAVNNLEVLSGKARQRVLVTDIVAELPIISP